MLKFVHVLLLVAALAALAVPFAWALDRAYGRDVILLATVNDEVEQEAARYFSDHASREGDARREAVAAIYGTLGTPEFGTERVLVFDDAVLIVPDEDPALSLRPAGSAGEGDYPVQSRSVRFVANRVTLAGLLAVLVLLAARRLLVRRRATPA